MSEKLEVRVHIDEHTYHSPVPTDGDALYALGHVKRSLVLYREVAGDQEDQPVPQGKEHMHLTRDEQFHRGEPHHVGEGGGPTSQDRGGLPHGRTRLSWLEGVVTA
jgi:hypothetical protein